MCRRCSAVEPSVPEAPAPDPGPGSNPGLVEVGEVLPDGRITPPWWLARALAHGPAPMSRLCAVERERFTLRLRTAHPQESCHPQDP